MTGSVMTCAEYFRQKRKREAELIEAGMERVLAQALAAPSEPNAAQQPRDACGFARTVQALAAPPEPNAAQQPRDACGFARTVQAAHEEIFREALPSIAGVFRQRNIRKSEPILFGRSVRYARHEQIEAELDAMRPAPNAATREGKISAAADFAKTLWQIHPFENGNTRLSAAMLVLYLRRLGFKAQNEPFKRNAKLLRNALVRAAYSDERVGRDSSFLFGFICNAVLGVQNDIGQCMQPVQELLVKN